MRVRHFVLLAALAALLLPAGANASELIARNAVGTKLQVNADGQALLTYVSEGKKWNVLAWGAVNALAPTQGKTQISFKLDYSGGWGTYRKDVWRTFKNTCGPYTGPQLAWFVTACTARDGSHWAVQAWQRMLPELRPRAVAEAGCLGAPAFPLDRRAARS